MDHGFILHPTYTVEDNKPIVQLLGRLENGETFLAEFEQKPHFFIRKKDLDAAKSITEIDTESTNLKTMEGDPVVQVNVRIPKDVPGIRSQLEDAGIPCFEADIRFAYRYLIDHNITGDCVLKGDYVKGTRVDRYYKEPKIMPGDYNGELKVLSIDIETDKHAGDLWSVALVQGTRKECLIIHDKEVKDAERCADEKQLLERLTQLVMEFDPDIITGWNVIDFDLNILKEKYEEHEMQWDWGRLARPSRLRLQSDFMRDSTADIPGRMVLDGIHLLKSSFIRLDSYTLEYAAQEFLGEGKLFKGKDRYADIEKAYRENPEKLVKYNVKDAQLVLDIIEATGVVKLTIERSRITGMQLDRVRASIASLDMVYLPALRERGYVAPSSGFAQKDKQITGGYVMVSKPGIYDYVIVCDFKSLYPSIMLTLNIDPLAFRLGKKQAKSNEDYVVAENGAVFSKEQGILPGILQELWNARDAAKKRNDKLGSNAIKILMNSFFGVLASPNCRFFSMDVANAITNTGQHLIKKVAEKTEEMGFEVIYSDTDSVFINLNVSSEQAANELGIQIQNEINSFLEGYVTERYKQKSFLELEFEKTYIRFMMPKTRSGEGSKKRYAGLLKKDGKEEVDFVGLEFVRRDWTELSKEFQLGILDRIFHKKDPQKFIREFVDDLRDGNKDDLLIYRKALRKKLEDYTKTTPPHVKAARLMKEITSNIIEYVMTVDGPEPIENQQHSLDYEHYIEKQLKPIADSILGFYDTNFEDVLQESSQRGLFEF